jgi:hypothetical protein
VITPTAGAGTTHPPNKPSSPPPPPPPSRGHLPIGIQTPARQVQRRVGISAGEPVNSETPARRDLAEKLPPASPAVATTGGPVTAHDPMPNPPRPRPKPGVLTASGAAFVRAINESLDRRSA